MMRAKASAPSGRDGTSVTYLASHALFFACALLLWSCEGPAGTKGSPGSPGTPGAEGTPGTSGADGGAGRNAYLTGPGLKIEVTAASVDADGKVTVTVKMTDDAGVALDREGRFTEGAVTARFVLAWLQADGGAYHAYTTRSQTSPITHDTAVQASTDGTGTFSEVGPGIYTYQFATLAAPMDRSKTHTVGIYASRPFAGKSYVANATHDFVPDGSNVTAKHDGVQTSACNQCHGRLAAHGGQRREIALCVLCHQPQTVDPDTGNTVDFRVMIHKIHRGKSLPSVLGGTPYQLIGFGQAVSDYSTVGYPQDIRGCATCHTGSQGDAWKTHPTRQACGSCHDRTSFVDPAPPGTTPHSGGPQADDGTCTVCHPSSGGPLGPSGHRAGITDAHLLPIDDPSSPRVAVTLLDATDTGPGQTPVIRFEVRVNGNPKDILAQPLTRIVATLAGPTTDYRTFWQATIQGSGAEGTLTAVDASMGRFAYTLPGAKGIPPGATGTYAIGFEAYLQPPGAARSSADNPILFVAVTDPMPVPRRRIADAMLCNRCHRDLGEHGGQRKNVDYCAMCHDASNVNDERVARLEGGPTVAHSVHLKVMIHKIHSGENLDQQPYVLGGFPAPSTMDPDGTPLDFGEVRFPGDRRNCQTCHVAGSYDLPLPAGLLPSEEDVLACTEDSAADTDSFCNTRVVSEVRLTPPASAACTSCHDAPATVAHTEIMTSMMGVESCAVCHRAGQSSGTDKFHALDP